MAVFPVQFPEDWPDFVVTSHIREKGSHKTGLAIDITPIWPSGDYSPSSKFWFYYFQTYFVLWSLQNTGLTLLSVPPTCPHLHIEYRTDFNRVGLEWINKVKGNCVPYYRKTISKMDLIDSAKFRMFVESIVGSGGGKQKYLGAWQNQIEGIKKKFDYSKRTVSIFSNIPSLPDTALQNIIDAMYGGTPSEKFINALSQIVTGHGWQDLKNKANETGGEVLLFATLGLLGYFVYSDTIKQRNPA